MLFAAAWIALSPALALEPAEAASAVHAAAPADVLPGVVSRAYLTAQGALRAGDDVTARSLWQKARALFSEQAPEVRYAREARDAVVRYELRLVEIARARFDRIRAPVAGFDTAEDLQDKLAEKRRLFLLLNGDANALDADGFVGALRFVPSLNPALRGVHCQRAELVGRFQRWLSELPCASELSDAECELAKARAADDDTAWRADVSRAEAQCRGAL